MGKERGIRPAQPVKPISSSLGLMDHPLELAACPANDIEIDPFQGLTQLRPVEVAVAADPAANDGIVDRGQLFPGVFAAMVEPPAPSTTRRAVVRRQS